MASERSPLLLAANSGKAGRDHLCCTPAVSMRYRTTCVTTRTGLFVLVILAVVNAVGFGPLFYYITTPHTAGYIEVYLPAYSFFMIELLMFPVAGLLGEVCCKRFKVLLFGSGLIVIGGTVFCLFYGLEWGMRTDNGFWQRIYNSTEYASLLLYAPFLLALPGVGIFQANALQYGVDQLDFASSEVLSSFVYWYYWTTYAFIGPLLALSFSRDFFGIISILSVVAVLSTCLICLTIYCCCKNPLLRTDIGHKGNPFKLIWKVMLFIKKNKFPLHRSAFTYNEMPSRFDLAKQRYGGPFTTEKVEDVKTFWRILLVLSSLVGFQLQDDTLLTFTEAVVLKQQYMLYHLTSPWTVTALVLAVVIPVYQFGLRPYFSQHIPNMLTRMGIGLIVVFISLLATTIYNGLLSSTALQVCANFSEVLCSSVRNSGINQNANNSCFANYSALYDGLCYSLYWLMIPQALNGFAHILVFLTTLEFILAQAPRIMQGFLIGLWYAMQSVNVGISIIGYSSCAAFHWQYYAAKTLLVLLSLVLFAIVAHKYKYRQLNEDADINVRQEIENAFEKNLVRKEIYLEQDVSHDEHEYKLCGTDSERFSINDLLYKYN